MNTCLINPIKPTLEVLLHNSCITLMKNITLFLEELGLITISDVEEPQIWRIPAWWSRRPLEWWHCNWYKTSIHVVWNPDHKWRTCYLETYLWSWATDLCLSNQIELPLESGTSSSHYCPQSSLKLNPTKAQIHLAPGGGNVKTDNNKMHAALFKTSVYRASTYRKTIRSSQEVTDH